MPTSYYDIDEILAEEELIPVTNLIDFQYLAYLDPNCSQRPIDKKSYTGTGDKARYKHTSEQCYLPEGTKCKMPLWSIVKWAELQFVQLSLPSHYSHKARKRLEAEPAEVDLRKKSEWFYMAGMLLIDLIKKCVDESSRGSPNYARMIDIEKESDELKQTLLLTYTGARLRRNFDWTLSNIEDDVSVYTQRLTEMERQLFARSAASSHAHAMWKRYGSRRIHVSMTALKARAMKVTSKIRKISMERKRGSLMDANSGLYSLSKKTRAF